MGKRKEQQKDGLFTLIMLIGVFLLNLLMQQLFDTKTLIPMIFVLGVFLVSLKTQGYFWGITASLISVLAVNYAFTFPYYAFDLITPECVSCAVVMLFVAVMTGALTTKIKMQEKIKAENELERMRGNLLRAISHDLRTPLTSISGSCSVMIENYDLLEKTQHMKLLGEIQEDSEWLIRMMENLLSVTRIGGEKVQISKMPTVLEELMDDVLLKFQKRCPKQKIQIDIPEEFVSIPMDAMLIGQVLINLLENAVCHAKGMTELRLTVKIEGALAVFGVSDDGCGIAQERLKGLFNGYQDKQGKEQPVDGNRHNMGIGLSVCSAIIRAHGGRIWVENRREGGAAFYFTLETERAYGE